jgi:RHS repeat-associated protein
VSIGATYNSFAGTTGSTSTIYANNWAYGFGGAGSLSSVSGGVVYTAGDGGAWLFTPVTGSTTAFNSPAGLKADLVKNTSTYTLTQRDASRVVTFDLNGNALSVADRNANATTMCYSLTPCSSSGGPFTTPPLAVQSPAGAGASPLANLSYSSSTLTFGITQANGSSTRTIQYIKDSSSNLTTFVDAIGKSTSFAYSGGKLSSITSPTGAVTNFSYDSSSGKLIEVDQLNTTSGSPGTSTTRFAYSSSTQTLVAQPDTSTSSGVSSVPHITYTLDSSQRVTQVTDEQSRQRAKTYTANFDTASFTSGTGTTAGTTTNTWGANSGQSLTQSQGPGGAADQAAYGNSSPATQFLPSTTTDDAGRTTNYTYDGPGNPLTTAQGSPTATATLTYNSDGTVATALGAGNGTNKTLYGYTSHQLTSITPVTGTSLGSRAITYDDFGRVKTATDGRGNTTTYGYDKDDRVTSTTFSDGTHSVVNTYDDAGKLLTSVDANGTITNTYDQLERLISTVNTVGGGTETYSYDKASNLITTTDGFGTTTNSYDTSNVLTSTKYPHNGSFQYLYYTTDDQGRRTDTYLQSDSTKTYWQGHTHYSYDPSGRVTNVTAQTGSAPTTITTVFNTDYCYNSGSAAPTCSTTSSTDRSQLQWSKDNLSGGLTTAYTYDGSGRIKTAAQSGSSSANTWNYTYDARGNRLTAVVTGANPSSQTLTYNAANQITTTGYSYDGTGNLTATPSATYTYNGAQQMTQAVTGSVTSTYTYAGASQNEVLSETFSGSTYKLTYGRPGQNGLPTIEQYKVGSGQAYLFSDPQTGQPIMLSTSSDQDCLYVMDGIGNPVGLLTDFATNAFTFAYDPYGAANLTAGGAGNGYTQNPYLFKAGIQDRATGLVKFGLRWYNPTTGTWTQQDTLDAPLDPANANRYAFAGGDPINGGDPAGLDDTSDALSSCGTSAVTSVAIGVIGADETGVGLVAAAAAGCIGGLLAYGIDQSTDSGLGTGLDLTGSALELGSALF